ncbi:MAG: GNAT family N-acetyltransferase [Ruminiclostridium sp.]|nr:GNAT family N-acetyltransferase [Ruminiclostridium sp.]
MKIVDAFWEKRNLGISCTEITLDVSDTISDLDRVLEDIVSDYTVLKIPVRNTSLQFELPKRGFVYAEDMMTISSDLVIPELNRIQQQLMKDISIEEMDDESFGVLLGEVRDGLFDSDRISIDPHFTAQQANERFCGWLGDEKSRGTGFYQFRYKGERVGFALLHDDGDGEFSSVLGGLYKAYRRSAIGNPLNFLIFRTAKKLGAKHLITNVSSNNPVQVRSLLACGYKLTHISHVYVRHSSDNKRVGSDRNTQLRQQSPI